ncbi:MAG: GH3 auxin-responsive promoter family protein, partial [Phycisphaerae bacterium]
MRTPLSIRLRRLATTSVRWEANRQVRRWRRDVRDTRRVQPALLARILAQAAGTGFGRDAGLDGARTVDDLRACLPIAGYERAAPYIDRVARGEVEALFPAGTRLHMFTMTSGTTGRSKYIPVTDTVLKNYRAGWHIWGAQALSDHLDAFGAKILQVSSRVDEERTASGLPAGAISALAAQSQRGIIRRMYVSPPACAYACDTTSKYYVACRLGLQCDRVMPITANPSTLLGLARTLDRRKEDLLRDLADGTLSDDAGLEGDARGCIERCLRARPDRARRFERLAEANGRLYPRDVWEVPLIGTWKGGTLSLYLRDMPHYWGETAIRDIGLVASEGRFSVPVESDGSAGILETTGTFYEFVPEAEIHNEHPTALLAHEVEVGRRYVLIVTTPGGLFRYNMGDVVQVTGRVGETPCIEFLNKGEHVANLTGEKVTEHHVIAAVNQAVAERGLSLAGYCLCPTWDEVPYYSLLVETDD